MSAQAAESYEKFNYLLRPCKQVERRLLIETLLGLADCGYRISEYAYLGFGSVYYADFILFHKYLYIKDMICVESSDIPKRMRFNRPYSFISLRIKPYSEVLPNLRRRKRHLVWLDYDRAIDQAMLADIQGSAYVLAPGSVLIFTVDARPSLPDDCDDETLSLKEKEQTLVGLYRQWFADLVQDIVCHRLARNEFPRLLWEAVVAQINQAVSVRRGLEFLQLFHYLYADNAPMLTIGGLIDTSENCAKVRDCRVFDLDFVADGPDPVVISVPPLTIREKQWLDSNLRADLQTHVRFELKPEMVASYSRFYREYPVYIEGLI